MTGSRLLHLSEPGWLWPIAASLAVAIAIVLWAYRGATASAQLRLTCAGLKVLGILLLALCLLDPRWTEQRVKPGANLVAVLADNSLSMRLHGRGEPASRGETLSRLLHGEENRWRDALARDFTVRNYLMGDRLVPTEGFQELDFSAPSTAVPSSLRSVAELHQGQPIAGIILLTDGIVADLDESQLEQLPPVFPVLIGNSAPPRDLAIAGTSITQTSFEDAPVTVTASILATGCSGDEVVAQILPLGASPKAPPVAEVKVAAPADGTKASVRFQFRPEKPGITFYKLRVSVSRDPSDEATLANNETTLCVDRGSGPHRILYVSGRPNWEYKFLQRSVAPDDQTQLVGLIRIAKREPKFDFRGRRGESSNPLFRGFGQQSAEEVERYDQPVLVRLNTLDEFELRDGFPKSAEDLFRYEAVILDDLEAEFFTPDQMTLVQRFVSERGGGLLMLGGGESFAEGKFQRTPIGELLPVYLDRAGAPPSPPLRLQLTREGWLQPWARLRATEAEERKRLEALPSFDLLNPAGATKPAASVIATVRSDGKEFPAVVAQPFGRGRSAALLVGDFWQSGMGDDADEKDLGRAWRQLVRWIIADVPSRVEVRPEVSRDGQVVRLLVRAYNERYEPMEHASVRLSVKPAEGGTAIVLSSEPSSTEPGVFESTYLPRESGGYSVEAVVTDDASGKTLTGIAGWGTDRAAAEFQTLTANRAAMERLAARTGGALIAPSEVNRFVRSLPTKAAPITETRVTSIWHTPWILGIAIGCLVAEWGLRRAKGLP